MESCYPANDISSHLLTPMQAKLLSDPAQSPGLSNAASSRVAPVAGVLRAVGSCRSLFSVPTALPFSPTCLHAAVCSPFARAAAASPIAAAFAEPFTAVQAKQDFTALFPFLTLHTTAPSLAAAATPAAHISDVRLAVGWGCFASSCCLPCLCLHPALGSSALVWHVVAFVLARCMASR